LIAAAVYVAAMLVFVYAIVAQSVGYGSDTANIAGLAGLGLLHIATGWFVARWWAVLLPFVVVPLAVPAGTPEGYEASPIWLGLAWFIAPLGALVIGITAAIHRLASEPAHR
jgi:hypothetical protein